MKVIVFGATGMIGQGAVRECIADPDVESVLCVGRSGSGFDHTKVSDLVRPDLFDYSDARADLSGYDACLFCVGVSAAGMDEQRYHRITFELTMAAAGALAELNPGMTFCFISGAGTDDTENGGTMWARVKGKTENHLLTLPFKAAYMFRPAYIQPLDGIKSKTRSYRIMYTLVGPLYPLLRRLFPRLVTNTARVGRAMLEVAKHGHDSSRLENADINRVAPG